jgi:type IV pilus assembly protein PilB
MKGKWNPIVKKRLGQILVERRIISPLRLQAALDRQKKQNGKARYLGQILMEMGIPQDRINDALDAYGKRKPLGEILVDLGILTPDQLQEALEKQDQLAQMGIRRPLGRLLLEMGYSNYETLLEALSRHFNMPVVALRGFFPSPTLQKAVGQAFAQKNKILVLENNYAKVRIALAEPDPFLMDQIRRTFPVGKLVEFCLASPFEMDSCLRQKFDPYAASHYR